MNTPNNGALPKTDELAGKRVAILATNGFEQEELTSPREALEAAGARTEIVSVEKGTIRGWKHTDWGDAFEVDTLLSEARPENYDALILPGGVINPDLLRREPAAVAFVREVFKLGKAVGAICHGPWMLIEAGVVKGRRMTSFPSIKTDMKNAGAEWVDEEVVTDNGMVTSRRPADLPAFNRKVIEEIREGRHERDGRIDPEFRDLAEASH